MKITTKLLYSYALSITLTPLLIVAFIIIAINAPKPNLESSKERSVRNTPEVRHAMKVYREAHPYCEWDNCSNAIEVHHIKPVAWFPELASDTNNMISLAKQCHLILGHAHNYRKYYVENIKAICQSRIVITNGP